MTSGLFRHQFILAMPGQVGGGFNRSLAFIAEHNDDGAMGLVINKPVSLKVNDVLSQLDINTGVAPDVPVYWGGPVQPERGFVLHRDDGDWESTLHLPHDLSITTSQDILEAIGNGAGPDEYLILLGYAGWGDGQLEDEMRGNSWLNAPADNDIIFATPAAKRWAAAARQLGVSGHQLSGHAGHA